MNDLEIKSITKIILEDISNLKRLYLKPVKIRIPISIQKTIFEENKKHTEVKKFGRLKELFGLKVVQGKYYEIVIRGRWNNS